LGVVMCVGKRGPALGEFRQHEGSRDQREIRRRADVVFECQENKTPVILVDVATKQFLSAGEKLTKPENSLMLALRKRLNHTRRDSILTKLTVLIYISLLSNQWELLEKKRLIV
jgi:hypothetical protein